MTDEYVIRSIRNSDTEQVLDLIRNGMGESIIPRTREYWEWKHVQNPFGPSPALLAEANGKLIGLRVFMRWIWQTGDRSLNAARAVDTVTHPDWRGKQVFSRLTTKLLEQCRVEGLSFVFNTPNQSSLPGYLKMGWQKITRIPFWIRPLRPFRMIGKWMLRKNCGIAENTSLVGAGIRDFSERRPDTGELRLNTPKNKDYLLWRYAVAPELAYHAKWQCTNAGSALVIYRHRKRKNWIETGINELLVGPGENSTNIATALVAELLKESPADYAVAVAAEKTVERDVLKQLRFVCVRRLGPVMTLRKFDDLPADVSVDNWSDWRCSLGDLELF